MKLISLIFLSTLIAACSPSDNSSLIPNTDALDKSQIINGSELKPTEIPQMSALREGVGSDPFCSATLIGPNVIITAAHCVLDSSSLYFGPVNNTYYKVKMIVNPKYKSEYDHNIPFDFAIKHDTAIGILEKKVVGITPVSITELSPQINDIVLTSGTGLPRFTRRFGFSKVITVSPLGVTIRGFGDHPQAGAPGDSGGPQFLLNKKNEIRLFAVASTSTLENDLTRSLDWAEALPYTEGVAKIIPSESKGENSFIKDAALKNKLSICGLNLVCGPVYWN